MLLSLTLYENGLYFLEKENMTSVKVVGEFFLLCVKVVNDIGNDLL